MSGAKQRVILIAPFIFQRGRDGIPFWRLRLHQVARRIG